MMDDSWHSVDSNSMLFSPDAVEKRKPGKCKLAFNKITLVDSVLAKNRENDDDFVILTLQKY
jgi:hypothetical protein